MELTPQNVATLRKDFPILQQEINGEPLIYFDNAATSQMPLAVLESLETYYLTSHANVYRSPHMLSYRATEQYEAVRELVREFIHASYKEEIIFTRGTTTSLNMVAHGFASKVLQPGDQIGITMAEHHSNLVPWQVIAERTGAELVYLPIQPSGELDLEAVEQQLSPKMKMVAISHVSNALGIIQPIQELAERIHQYGGYIVVDGAQSVPHMPVNVKELGVDFYAWSGHKMVAPTGIGVLYGRKELLNMMEPLEYGGEMIHMVGLTQTDYKSSPYKFEAGTPNIAGVIGLGAAIKYLQEIGLTNIERYERELAYDIRQKLKKIDGVTVYGSEVATSSTGVISFNIDRVHPHDVATAMDQLGIAIRAGHHCCQPLMRHHLNVPATARASLYFYNTIQEVDRFIRAVELTKEYFSDGF